MITLQEAAQATGGDWIRGGEATCPPLHGAAFDSRALGTAQIFFALQGEQADGHQYLPRLAGSSVQLAVVSREADLGSWEGSVLRVPDPLQAMADMARYVVAKHSPTVVAITGSYGKTTTKEIVAHVLAGERRVRKSEGSLNNEIGIPVTLLGLDGSEDVVVLEFSARNPGDIAYLGAIAPPHLAVLLSVGRAHIGVFGDQDTIYRTKGEIFQHLHPGGLALVGAHDPRLAALATGHRTLTFGRDTGDFHAESITLDGDGFQQFQGVTANTRLNLQAGMPGPNGCEPVLVAWAVARELGVSDATVAERSGVAHGQKGRANPLPSKGGAVIIDDCYNASPETVVNLIGILGTRSESEKVLVLGPLAELEDGLGISATIIANKLTPPLSQCLLYEPEESGLSQALREQHPEIPVHSFTRSEAFCDALRALDKPGHVLGVKGARSAHMERFVSQLQGDQVTCWRTRCDLLRYCTDCDQRTAL